MAQGDTLSAPIDVDVDDHKMIKIEDFDPEEVENTHVEEQEEDSDVEMIENPYLEEYEGPKDQYLEGPSSQRSQVPMIQHIEGPEGQQNDDPKSQQPEVPESQTQAPTAQQNQISDVQQNQGPIVQQAARHRLRSKQPDALKAVIEELRPIAERNGPTARGKGLNMSHGVDIIHHKKMRSNGAKGEPTLTQLGVVVVALRMLEKYEETLREQPTEAEINALNREFPPLQIGGLIPFAALKSQIDTQPYVSMGLQVDPSGHAEIAFSSTGISPNVALEMPPPDAKRVLVDKDYLLRIEKENELYRYHMRDLEMGVANRLENILRHAFRGTQDKGQKSGNVNDEDGDVQNVKVSKAALKASKHKGIYMLILKLPPKLLNLSVPHKILTLRLQPKLLKQLTQEYSNPMQQLHNANRKRGTEVCEAQVTLVAADEEALNKEALNNVQEDSHIDKKTRLDEEPVV